MNESIIRTLSGLVYIILLVSATLYSPFTFAILFGIFLILSVVEFCRLANLDKAVPIVMALAGLMLFGYNVNNNPASNLMLNLAALFISVSLLMDLFKTGPLVPRDKTAKLARLTGYVIIPFILIIKMAFLTNAFNPYIIIGMFILIWANDTFAYIVGKLIGRHKLLERISPKKTIEGFVGGMLFAVVGAYILGQSSYFNTALSPWQWMAFAAVLVIFGTLGDLVESQLKRNAGVKDSGKIMPGHGGILDRLDSVLFATPFLFLYYQILNYVS
ncbi:phosphatidate cytidylyltransferase [Flavobacterium sp. Sd200]|uniref:phosphatidate cytidylyltransferase n=1 Tax=Flavobacterium sp. Sd200 TaxID=2692211 RepID=UPI00136D2B5C|nr:phosphatidate cytidylyltransferase [Flavobacterium sp. Sd200]MXN92509.1 phosphatidate cytidylyltransferase [Flavobacterium sp. Sd200]